ncbi:MAG: hypothetical protein ABI824_18610 [Acidobacteriota bacterium]
MNWNRGKVCGFAAMLAVTAGLFALPAQAQVDLSGTWNPQYQEDQPERIPGPELVDFLGIPLNDYGRKWALAWAPDRLGLQEHQCQVHTAAYIFRGPTQIRLWEERDQQTQDLIAIHLYSATYEQNRVIYMDGRPHPPEYAAHTWMGFSTGEWDGNILTIHTTHIKQGWHRRNGIPSSDLIDLIDHFIVHGDQMTHVSVVTDPIYLSEPLVKSEDYIKAGNSNGNWLWPCEYVNELPGKDRSAVPNYLPGENPFLDEFRKKHNLPLDAVLGGAETMYPEYMPKAKLGFGAASK